MNYIKILVCVVAMQSVANACDSTKTQCDPVEYLQVSNASYSYENVGRDGSPILTAMGSITNTATEYALDGIVVEATFLDSKGKVIDVITEQIYSLTLWPSKSAAFRVQGSPGKNRMSYASVAMRPVSARVDISSSMASSIEAAKLHARSNGSWFERYSSLLVLVSVVLLIAAFLRWAHGRKGSLTAQIMTRLEEQNEFMRRQTEVMEKMIASRQGESKKESDGKGDS